VEPSNCANEDLSCTERHVAWAQAHARARGAAVRMHYERSLASPRVLPTTPCQQQIIGTHSLLRALSCIATCTCQELPTSARALARSLPACTRGSGSTGAPPPLPTRSSHRTDNALTRTSPAISSSDAPWRGRRHEEGDETHRCRGESLYDSATSEHNRSNFTSEVSWHCDPVEL